MSGQFGSPTALSEVPVHSGYWHPFMQVLPYHSVTLCAWRDAQNEMTYWTACKQSSQATFTFQCFLLVSRKRDPNKKGPSVLHFVQPDYGVHSLLLPQTECPPKQSNAHLNWALAWEYLRYSKSISFCGQKSMLTFHFSSDVVCDHTFTYCPPQCHNIHTPTYPFTVMHTTYPFTAVDKTYPFTVAFFLWFCTFIFICHVTFIGIRVVGQLFALQTKPTKKNGCEMKGKGRLT